jgi:hypothetical protein
LTTHAAPTSRAGYRETTIAEFNASHGILLNGQWCGAKSTFAVHDPATHELIAEVADGTAFEATQAVDAGRAFRAENRRSRPYGPLPR